MQSIIITFDSPTTAYRFKRRLANRDIQAKDRTVGNIYDEKQTYTVEVVLAECWDVELLFELLNSFWKNGV